MNDADKDQFEFDHETYCMIFCGPDSRVVQVASNIASKGVACMAAEGMRQSGGYVFGFATAGTLIAALELIKK